MIVQTVTTSFTYNALLGNINLQTDQIYMALYNGNAALDNTTAVYTSVNEVAGTGYTAGGQLMTNISVSFDNQSNTVFINWANVVWSPAAFTCRGALIYDKSQNNASIAVLNFGSDKTCSNSFTVTMPANTNTTALLRIS